MTNEKYWIEELNKLKKGEDDGFIVGVKIQKPRPWPPALEIIKLYNSGIGIKEIAKIIGYSTYTVERALKNKGEDQRTGPQCERYSGRIFSIAEALREMPIPCGLDCVCTWSPIFKFELETKNF